MATPLTGRREVFRRLNERNQGRRERVNQIREIGGLEPVTETVRNTTPYDRYVNNPSTWYNNGYTMTITGSPVRNLWSKFDSFDDKTDSKKEEPSDEYLYWTSQITEDEYLYRRKVKSLKEKEVVLNKESRFLLDENY